jgi:hypothetical protein
LSTLLDKLRNLREELSQEDHFIIDWAVMVIQDKLAQNARIINQEYEYIASYLALPFLLW